MQAVAHEQNPKRSNKQRGIKVTLALLMGYDGKTAAPECNHT
jgi:hypothetical protein